MTTKEAIDKIKVLLNFSAAPADKKGTSFPVDNGVPAFVDTSDDGISDIDKGDAVFTDEAMTMPYPDGAYTLTGSGTTFTVAGGVVTDSCAATSTDDTLETPEQMRAAIQKFADSTNPDTQKMAIVLKAVFENVFGWELRQAKEKADRDAAIATYQQGFKKQNEALTEVVALLEEFSKEPVTAPLEKKEWDNMSPLEKFRATK